MSHTLGRWLLHAKLVLLAVLKPLGIWGVAALAALDTSSIAIPMDIIVAGYIWTDRSRFWLYAVMVGLGSAIASQNKASGPC
jgi:membrane protein YqaA with SNARE-associated domain